MLLCVLLSAEGLALLFLCCYVCCCQMKVCTVVIMLLCVLLSAEGLALLLLCCCYVCCCQLKVWHCCYYVVVMYVAVS